MTTSLSTLREWVDEVAGRMKPDNIYWCTGSDDEYQDLISKMTADGTLSPLNQDKYPNCYLHLSDPTDVARVEHLTYVCTPEEVDAGPNNNWMSPDVRDSVLHGPDRLALFALWRRGHR